MTPDEALAALLEGNRRYVENRPRHPHQRAAHRPAGWAAEGATSGHGAEPPDDADPVDRAVRTNVTMVVEQLRADEPLLAPAVHEGRLRIVGTYYNLEDGTVEVIAA